MGKQRGFVVLCGFMGCGKSTVGRALSRLLGCDFLDLDAYIEEISEQGIPQIFATQGEETFRRMETDALRTLGDGTRLVLAAGGGTLLRAENAALIRGHGGQIVLLDCPFSVCYGRIRNSTRPIVRRSTPEELEAIYESRLPVYQGVCDFSVSSAAPAQETARNIAQRLLAQPGWGAHP